MLENNIVLSLDAISKGRALKIAEDAAPHVWGFKVHDLIFHYGAEIVYELKQFGKIIADARLLGHWPEMNNCLRIFRNAGADIITVAADVGIGDPGEDLASFGFKPEYSSYAYHVIRDITAGEYTCDVFQANIRGPSLSVYGRSLIASETLIDDLKKLNDKSLGQE